MVKLVMTVRRRDNVASEEFHRYWREEHGPLVRRLVGHLKLRRYVQAHTLDTDLNGALASSRGTSEAFDGLAELWFDSIEDMLAIFGTEEGRHANAALAEDEAKFIDLARSTIFLTEEFVVFDGDA